MDPIWRKAAQSCIWAVAAILVSVEPLQAQSVAQVVEQFFPASLPVDSPDERRMCHAVLQEANGQAELIAAGYANTDDGAVRLIALQGGTYGVTAESDQSLTMGGLDCSISLHDFNGDGQSDLLVRFHAMRGDTGWAFTRSGTSLQHVSASDFDAGEQSFSSRFANADVIDAFHDGTLQIASRGTVDPEALDAETASAALEMFRFDQGSFVHDRFVLAAGRIRKFEAVIDDGLIFKRAADSTGPYRVKVTNGLRGGGNRSSAQILLNGEPLNLTQTLSTSTEFAEAELAAIPVTNELRVIFPSGDSSNAEVTVLVEDGTTGRTPEQPNTQPPGVVPSADIGAVGIAGSSQESGGTYTVTASGTDIWGVSDQYHYTSWPLNGDGSIVARVATLSGPDAWSKAGVMMRESHAPGSAHAFALVSAANGLAYQRRVTADGATTHTSGGSGGAPRWVRLTRIGDAITAYTSTDGVAWTAIDTDSIAMPETIHVGLAVTSHDNTATAAATFDSVAITPGPWSSVPEGWSSQDIGAVGVPGATSYGAGSFTVAASGADVWNVTDEFHYVFHPLGGDGSITVRVSSVQNVHNWTKAGVMIRETLTGGSRHAFMFVSAVNGLAFQRRTATDGTSTHTAGEAAGAPRWVRLTRSGDTISAFSSVDGATWTLVGTETLAMSGAVYAGLAVTSHNNSIAATATFTDVSVSTD